MSWLEQQFREAIRGLVREFVDAIQGFTERILRSLMEPIVGVPAPESRSRYIVAGSPDNPTWKSLYQEVYLEYIVPLTLAMLFIGLAYVGIRSGAISDYRRKRLLRRIGLVFMGAFVWFPLVSIPLQFVDSIGMTVAPVEGMASSFGGATKGFFGGLFISLLMIGIENLTLLIAGLVYGLRYVAIIVLTLLMPLLGALWALEVWPLNSVSEIVRRCAAMYPGLVLAGLPAAFFFRIGWEANFFTPQSLFDLFISLMMVPGACIASILTVYWSSPAIQRLSRTGGRETKRGAPKVKDSVQTGAGKSVRGARNVHRGYAENTQGAITSDGGRQSGSRAYDLGSSARSAVDHAGEYNNLRKSSTGRMRDKARDDARQVATAAKARSKRAFRRTKRMVSRW